MTENEGRAEDPTAARASIVGHLHGSSFAKKAGSRAPDSQVARLYLSAVTAGRIADDTLVSFRRAWRWGEQCVLGVQMGT